MKKSFWFITLGLFLLLILFGMVSPQVSSLTGIVVNQGDQPIPGLTLFLVHPVIGRSFPSITDNRGLFSFLNVPLRNDPYYLEIYCGMELIYKNTVMFNMDKNLVNIILR